MKLTESVINQYVSSINIIYKCLQYNDKLSCRKVWTTACIPFVVFEFIGITTKKDSSKN